MNEKHLLNEGGDNLWSLLPTLIVTGSDSEIPNTHTSYIIIISSSLLYLLDWRGCCFQRKMENPVFPPLLLMITSNKDEEFQIWFICSPKVLVR